jgi:hypothetical protein
MHFLLCPNRFLSTLDVYTKIRFAKEDVSTKIVSQPTKVLCLAKTLPMP